ncbi:MAG: ImmA/IrrE family metallo-endopeptidase [Nitrosomonadales bacterium]|nr:ImmA/IrrE family metallo-endopeptidase [Nitrosomonadales bacterium]
MSKSLSKRITQSRLLLSNPYAYLDDFGGYSALPQHVELAKPSNEEITRSRRLMQDPYAHLDESGGFSAIKTCSLLHVDARADVRQEIPERNRRTPIELERQVRNLHRRMWQSKNKIWFNAIPSNPIDMLDPIVALKFIGFDCDLVETLGQCHIGGQLTEIAGTIDKSSAKVRISRQFQHNIRSFTAAHELGHAILHQTDGLHRDRPLNGETISRNEIEMEADKFATFFLMPRKLVKNIFEKYFLTNKFAIDEATAYALGQGDSVSLMSKCKTLRQLSKMLANAEQYNGLHFTSLAKQFRVSTDAMAIRLEELELVVL